MTTRQTLSDWEPDPDGPEAVVFDSFARCAGASLRSPAPEDGLVAVARRGTRQRNVRLATEIGVVGLLVLGGIVLFTPADRTRPTVDLPPTPTTADILRLPTSVVPDAEISQWFPDYTGNPAGPAAGEPVKFGVVMPLLTYELDLDIAAKYLNDRAGGVGGRPIEFDVCQQPLTECADRFAADPAVIAVLENRWSGDSIGTALAGRKPLHTTYAGDGTAGVGYYPTYREVVNAMALQAERLTAPGARVLVIDASVEQNELTDPSLRAFVTPDLSSELTNRDVVTIKALKTEHLVDTIRRAGLVDPVAVILATPPEDESYVVHPFGRLVCDELYDSLGELHLTPLVIVGACEPHDRWYRLDIGFNETTPDMKSGVLPIAANMPGLGGAWAVSAARGIYEVGALLAVIRVINQIGGPAQATPAALDQALREFTGPLPLGAGPLDCSPTGKVAERVPPGSCVRFVDVHQFVHDRWIDLAPIDLGS
jgi:hypothetical protein